MEEHALHATIAIKERRVWQRESAEFFWVGGSVDLLRSRYTPHVAVVKTANLRNRNDGAELRWVHGPRFRRVLGQRKVRPGFVIIRQE